MEHDVDSPEVLEASLGESVRALRLRLELPQQVLAERAGVSLGVLKRLERGEGATVGSLVRVVRALGREDWLYALQPAVSVDPLALADRGAPRQRAPRRRRDG